MKVIPTALAGVLILEPKVFGDERGFFLESFNQQRFDYEVLHGYTVLDMSQVPLPSCADGISPPGVLSQVMV